MISDEKVYSAYTVGLTDFKRPPVLLRSSRRVRVALETAIMGFFSDPVSTAARRAMQEGMGF